MHLKHIKLAGFKSFVDPTTVSFPSNLCAIVGPNGCGKSNIIDAVRWVMGESSAKNLRGESMSDVIFNGSTSRKPVGQASIELVFDNTDATVKGEYAGFNEISVRRKVTRDGQNNYYLNGSKCRRRDIVDIFLGTGLGPRSYAIIEQGMISRLIESKPEELRVYIEEAAGISKYKERRRDTENRMRRTKENLERLTDIREELERQLIRLERQAKAAEKYAELKQQEREIKAQLEALRYRLLDQRLQLQQQDIRERELAIEALVTEGVSYETAIEKHRGEHAEQTDKLNEIQGRFYAVGTDIARIEQRIQHLQERHRQLRDDLAQVETESEAAGSHLRTDEQKAQAWEVELREIAPQLEQLQALESDSSDALLSAEEAMQAWQQGWDEFNLRAAEPRQRAEVEQSRIQHLEQVQSRLLERIRRLEEENQGFADEDAQADDLPLLEAAIAELATVLDEQQQSVDSIASRITALRERISQTEDKLSHARGQLQTAQARYASLEALQQGALAGNDKLDSWLQAQAIDQQPRLLEQVSVADKWQLAAEVVLGDALHAVCVDELAGLATLLETLEQGQLVLLDKQASGSTRASALPSLAAQVSGSADVQSLLANVYLAEDLSCALLLREQLQAGESLVTPDGIWLGNNWLRVKRDSRSESSMLARQQQLEQLSADIAQQQRAVEEMTAVLSSDREQLNTTEAQREQQRRELDQQRKHYHEQQAQCSALQVRLEQHAMRRQKVQDDINEAKEQMDVEKESLSEARVILQEAIESMEGDNEQKDKLLKQRDDIRGRLDDSRQRARHDKDSLHALAMRHQSVKTQLQSIHETIARLREQVAHLQNRREQLQANMGQGDDPSEDLQLELEALLEKRMGIEENVMACRRQAETAEQQLRDVEQSRARVERELQALRNQLSDVRVAAQTLQVQRETIAKQLLEDDKVLADLLAVLPVDAAEAPFEETLLQLHHKIMRLGAINLAAIDEYKVESERKAYLDAQNADLQEALTTLENAILKIDKETRTRFKETFDTVNAGIKELFPKVFGGGHAYLELTGDDMLDTGVTIMAQPPGKRNTTIHLLSGGEKALTAISMVFSIFRLNPAPFCMLDEVDAPLDDANVGRYARLVKDMSETVQFICITHNKIAMEVAHQLMGVTMHEAGVSRLVTVDVNEAAELAAV
ncbi:MAG: chromosome segregation protein SMC [Cellvibrionaceae bacterium]|nr:chromosome segregation protein SMC [Cellvibrionaceae bacterium]